MTQGAMQLDFNIWGFIPSFLSERDPRKAREQFNEHYQSGWRPFKEFTLNKDTMTLTYPDDPPMKPIDYFEFRDEIIYMYPHAFVLILQRDGSFEVCLMD